MPFFPHNFPSCQTHRGPCTLEHVVNISLVLTCVACAVATWPGLCTILMQSVDKEFASSAGKKKGPDAGVSRAFKRFVQAAEDERRSGAHRSHCCTISLQSHPRIVSHPPAISPACRLCIHLRWEDDCSLSGSGHAEHYSYCSINVLEGIAQALERAIMMDAGRAGMLARRAAKLFAHVRDVLQAAKLGSAIGGDYAAMLRASLLAVPAYCAAAPASVFQGEAGSSQRDIDKAHAMQDPAHRCRHHSLGHWQRMQIMSQATQAEVAYQDRHAKVFVCVRPTQGGVILPAFLRQHLHLWVPVARRAAEHVHGTAGGAPAGGQRGNLPRAVRPAGAAAGVPGRHGARLPRRRARLLRRHARAAARPAVGTTKHAPQGSTL